MRSDRSQVPSVVRQVWCKLIPFTTRNWLIRPTWSEDEKHTVKEQGPIFILDVNTPPCKTY